MVESRNDFNIITNSVNCFKSLKRLGALLFNAGCDEQVFSPKP